MNRRVPIDTEVIVVGYAMSRLDRTYPIQCPIPHLHLAVRILSYCFHNLVPVFIPRGEGKEDMENSGRQRL